MTLRMDVVSEARAWLGTPYHAHARIKGVGVDCVHLLCAVYEAVGLTLPIDPGHYPISWALSRSEELYLAALDGRASRIDQPHAGDVALFKFGRTFSHAGIVTERATVVHAFNRVGGGSVIETPLAEPLLAKRAAVFYDLYSIRT